MSARASSEALHFVIDSWMSAVGTPRRIAAVRRFGRDRSEADMPRASGAGRSDENAEEARGIAPRAPQAGRVEARAGLRMMPTFPRPSLSFRTAGFPRYGWRAGVVGRALPPQRPPQP